MYCCGLQSTSNRLSTATFLVVICVELILPGNLLSVVLSDTVKPMRTASKFCQCVMVQTRLLWCPTLILLEFSVAKRLWICIFRD